MCTRVHARVCVCVCVVAMIPLQTVVSRLTSPKKILAGVGAGLTLLAFARIAVLVVESYSAVWSERLADRELVRMCDSGTASMSADFRALCLKKRAEQSAPVLLKALLRACATAFTDFCESMSSPTKVVLLLLFCLTGVAAPVVKALSMLFVDHLRRRKRRGSRRGKSHDSDNEGSDDDEAGHHEIVVVTPDGSMNGTRGANGERANALTMRLRRSVRRLRHGGITEVSSRGGPLALGDLAEHEDEWGGNW